MIAKRGNIRVFVIRLSKNASVNVLRIDLHITDSHILHTDRIFLNILTHTLLVLFQCLIPSFSFQSLDIYIITSLCNLNSVYISLSQKKSGILL